ncbi:MAG TPA: MFS transporter, partial [Bdellovibrionales bacterium]|nr:MFS transporter [Bdellovibrionales bacterium]
MKTTEKPLLFDRRFWPIFWTQFLGAFNDNVFKNALVILITFKAYSIAGLSPEQMVALSGGVFILPFFLFSAIAGQIADKLPKSSIVVGVKLSEIAFMILGTVGFLTEHLSLLMATLFLMGLHSTFFGPIKYSILPEVIENDELVAGNAYVELGTFLAILLGTILGGTLISVQGAGAWLVGGTTILLACAGTWTGLKVLKLEPSRPDLKIQWDGVRPTIQILKLVTEIRSVFLSVLGISWFWFLGAAFLSLLPPYCKDFLHSSESLVTFFLALFSIGVGLGSLLCEKFSFRKLELGLVPVGSIGISLFLIDLYFASQGFERPESLLTVGGFLSTWTGWRITIDLILFSMFSGFFIVPLYTLIQQRAEPGTRSRIIAANNIINAFFMVISSVGLAGLYALKLSIPQIFMILSLLNVAVAIYIYTVIPEFLFRFICWCLANLLYRLKMKGVDYIPDEGPAVLVCNHVSFIDWLIIASATQRPVRFVMHHSFMKIPFAGWIFRDAKVIPIAGSKEDPEILNEAFDRIAHELRAGELVCIFPEGAITHDGEVAKFRPGIERILKETPVPVVPMALDGLWGSFFSRKGGNALRKPFRRFWSRVSL